MMRQRLATGATGVKQARYRRRPTRGSVVLRCSVAFWMLPKLLIWLITRSCFRNLLIVVFLFLFFGLTSWYKFQKCCVRWGSCFSAPFSVSNGVCQGSVLSPLLFAVYIDELLSDLSSCEVAIVVICLLAVSVMQTILLHVNLHCVLCCLSARTLPLLTSWNLTPPRHNLSVSGKPDIVHFLF